MPAAAFKHLQITDLDQRMNNTAEQVFVVVDIRDPASFQQGHIPNAIHLTNDNLADFLREADPDVETIVCCYHGNSSQQAAQFLVSQDFTNVYSLDGGFSAWQLAHPTQVER